MTWRNLKNARWDRIEIVNVISNSTNSKYISSFEYLHLWILAFKSWCSELLHVLSLKNNCFPPTGGLSFYTMLLTLDPLTLHNLHFPSSWDSSVWHTLECKQLSPKAVSVPPTEKSTSPLFQKVWFGLFEGT